jgi:hypothetical protein
MDRITIKQAAALTGYSEGHLRRLCKEAESMKEPHFVAELFGYNWAIDRDSLLAFVQKQKSKGGQAGPR